MFLIPLGVEGRTVYRVPWATLGLLAANLLVFAVAAPFEHARVTQVGLLASMVKEALEAHPYLSVPERFGAFLDEEALTRIEESSLRWRREGKSLAAAELSRQQRDLDALVADFCTQLERLPSRRFGFAPASGGVLELLTAMFMHAGWLHLLGNMLVLYVSAPYVEDLYGPALFLACYALGGIAASLGQALADPQSTVPLVGASGAIAGVMGIVLVRLVRERIRLLFLPIPVLPMVRIPLVVPTLVLLPAWVGQQLIEARFAAPGGGGVAWWAHITGFLFGAALATAVKVLRLEERREARALRGGTDRLIESAQRARAQGDLEAAREFLRRLLAARPNDVTAWREAVELGFASGDMAEITRAATRLLELQAPDADPAAVLELLEDTRWSELPARSSRLSMAIARFFEKRGEKERALEHYEDVIQAAGQDVMGLRALIRKGELLIQAGRRHAARESLMLARSHPACHGVSAESVDRTLGELESRRLPADRAPDRPS